jgi:hypothetical protein
MTCDCVSDFMKCRSACLGHKRAAVVAHRELLWWDTESCCGGTQRAAVVGHRELLWWHTESCSGKHELDTYSQFHMILKCRNLTPANLCCYYTPTLIITELTL